MTAAGRIGVPRGNRPIRVLLLEDHDLVRTSVAHLVDLEPDMRVVAQSASATEALELVADTEPEVALLDVRHPDVRCLMLTSFSDDRAVLDAAMAGASGFVLKQIRTSHTIVDSIRDAASGAMLLDEATVDACLRRLEASERAGLAKLTRRQRRLFDLIGSGRSNAQIAEVLDTDLPTVRNDISVLLRRLGMVRRTEVSDAYRRRNGETDATPSEVGPGEQRVLSNGS